MQKATIAQVVTINALMLQTIAQYVNTFVAQNAGDYKGDGDDLQSITMYAGDVAHNANALAAFNKDKNADKLHNAIMLQDTLVREEFTATLQFLEDNNLASKHLHACR
jgi:hypothetical protein